MPPWLPLLLAAGLLLAGLGPAQAQPAEPPLPDPLPGPTPQHQDGCLIAVHLGGVQLHLLCT